MTLALQFAAMKTLQHSEESLCRSYLTAVAAVARHNLWLFPEHDYSVDGQFRHVEKRGNRLAESGFGFDFQAKASINCTRNSDHISYDLDATAYNDLVARSKEPRGLPYFLILLSLHPDLTQWLAVDEENLILKHTAYYFQLSGDFTDNTGTKTIKIPRANHLTPPVLTTLLNHARTGTLQP